MLSITKRLLNEHKALLSPAVVIAGLTVIGYLNALLFEIGYLNNYGINYQFAQVNTKIFILFGVITIAVCYVFMSNTEIFVRAYSWWKPKSALGHLLRICFLTLTTALLVLMPAAIYFNQVVPALIAALILGLYPGVSRLILDGRGAKGLNDKAEKALFAGFEEEDEEENSMPLVFVVLGIVFLLTVSAFAGKEFADSRRTYALTSDGYAVIRSYDDVFILAQINANNDKLTGKYIYRSNNADLQFTSKNMHLKR